MATPVARRSLGQLLRQGYDEIPEVFAATIMGIVGIGLGTIGCYRYINNDGDNRRYKKVFVIMRPDDPRVNKVIESKQK